MNAQYRESSGCLLAPVPITLPRVCVVPPATAARGQRPVTSTACCRILLHVLSSEIRERFLRFFEERGHHRLASFPLIPHDDPSLLFTVAGMVPLKPWITGQRNPPSRDLVSCQKCFRGAGLKYDDIASVGDPTHHTFFELSLIHI